MIATYGSAGGGNGSREGGTGADTPTSGKDETSASPVDAIVERIEWLERESSARGGDAALLYEIGRLWEAEGRDKKRAARAYERAHKVDPSHLPTLRAARAIFADSGHWTMVSRLLLAEENATTCPGSRLRLQRERALVLAHRLGRHADARILLEKALSIHPEDPALLADLAGLVEIEDPSRPDFLASLNERWARSLPDGPPRARLLSTAASLHEGRLDRRERATELYRAAWLLDPLDPIVSSEHQRQLERSGLHEEWMELLVAEAADREARGEPVAPTLYRLARLQLRADREDDALATLLKARELAPEDRLILSELSRIHTLRQSWEDLADVLRQRARIARDDGEKISLFLDLGALYEEKLERPEAAIQCHRAVVAHVPSHGLALAALGKLLHQAGDWQGLISTFEAEALAASDPRQRAARLFKAAQLVEEKLDHPDEAITRYRHILDRLPGYLPARQALCRLYEKHERFDDWIRLLEEEIVGADRDLAVSTLARIAELQEQRQHAPREAMATYKRLLELAPDHLPTIRALARLAEETGDWEELIRALEREAARSSDQRQVVGLLQQCAEILDEHIGDRQRATDAYRRVLDISPSYLPALRALGRIYRQKGQWAELVSMHLQEAEASRNPEIAAAQLFRVGELYEQKLFDEERAVVAYREVLECLPGHLPALRQLTQIYRHRAEWDSLVEVLGLEAGARRDPAEKAAILCQIAEIREERQGRTDLAREAWKEALRWDPSLSVALSSLERILLNDGAMEELVTWYERAVDHLEGQSRTTLQIKAARILLDFLGRREEAGLWLEQALSMDPEHPFGVELARRLWPSAPRPMDRAELLRAIDVDPHDCLAWDRLERHLEQQGDAAALTRILERRLEWEVEPSTRLSLLYRLGQQRMEAFGDDAGALACWDEALELDPNHLPLLVARGRLLEMRLSWEALRENLLQQVASSRDESHIAGCLIQASEVAEVHLGDLALAESDCRALLERSPDHPLASARLGEIVATRGGPEALAALYSQRAEAATTPRAAADAWIAAASVLHEDLDRLDEAELCVEKALDLEPLHPGGLELSAAIAAEKGLWHHAASALEKRIEGGPGTAPFHLRLSRILTEKLADPIRALPHARAAVEGRPDDREALTLLARLQVITADWKGALLTIKRCLAREPDPYVRFGWEMDLARVHEVGLGDLSGAAGCYERALRIRPDDLQALEKLAGLYEKLKDFSRLVGVLETRASLEADSVRAASLWNRSGQLRASHLADGGGAIHAWRKALHLDPGARDAKLALASLLAAEPATLDEAVDWYRSVLDSHPLHVDSWRALFGIWQNRGEDDRAFVAAAALEVLGAASPQEQAFHREALARMPIRPSGALSPEQTLALLGDPAPDPSGSEILRTVGWELEKVFPPDLGRWKVSRAHRLPADHPLHLRYRHFLSRWHPAPSLGAVYGTGVPDTLAVVHTQPPSVVIHEGLEGATPRILNFLLGRLAWTTRVGVASFLDTDPGDDPQAGLESLLHAAVRLHVPGWSGWSGDPTWVRKLKRSLSRRSRKVLEGPARRISATADAFSVPAFLAAHRKAADRVALVLCGDPLSAARALAGPSADQPLALSAAVRDLLRFSASEGHFQLRSLMGMALGTGVTPP